LIDLATLESVSDLTSEHAKLAASSSGEIRKLLKRVAEIAQPGEGCPKIMMALARLVGQPWVEGDLRIELSGDESSTTMNIMCDYGVGIRERLLPLTRFGVPIDEFERALELAPKLVLPLRISEDNGKLVLTPLATPEARVRSIAPPPIAVDNGSLGDGERATAPPPADELQVVDEAMPDDFATDANPDSGRVDIAAKGATAENDEHEGRMRSGTVPTGNVDEIAYDRVSNVHTRPTVRRMVAVDAAAIAALKRRDPRREDE
jgi:hypothetical protein